MKTVLLLGGPAAGQLVQVHGTMDSVHAAAPGSLDRTTYYIAPLCSHGVVHWFGVLDKSHCPLVALIQGYKL